MKIQIGNVITKECVKWGNSLALHIPGVGAILAIDDPDDPPFLCISLDKKQLKKLLKEITRILHDE